MQDLILIKIVGKERVDEIGKQCGLTAANQRILFDILGELGYHHNNSKKREQAIKKRTRGNPNARKIKLALIQVIEEYLRIQKLDKLRGFP